MLTKSEAASYKYSDLARDMDRQGEVTVSVYSVPGTTCAIRISNRVDAITRLPRTGAGSMSVTVYYNGGFSCTWGRETYAECKTLANNSWMRAINARNAKDAS